MKSTFSSHRWLLAFGFGMMALAFALAFGFTQSDADATETALKENKENMAAAVTRPGSNLAIEFQFGECYEESGRTILEIQPNGQTYLLSLNDGNQTGQERSFRLQPEQHKKLQDSLYRYDIFSLPTEILAEEGQIPVDFECSELSVTSAQSSISIREAGGTNRSYFAIKEELKRIILSYL